MDKHLPFFLQTLQFFDDILDELENESESTSSAASTPETEECMECEQRGKKDFLHLI